MHFTQDQIRFLYFSCNNWQIYLNVNVLDATAVGVLLLLPTLLPESAVTTLSARKGKKRSFWKPSVAEVMAQFINIKKVAITVFRY